MSFLSLRVALTLHGSPWVPFQSQGGIVKELSLGHQQQTEMSNDSFEANGKPQKKQFESKKTLDVWK